MSAPKDDACLRRQVAAWFDANPYHNTSLIGGYKYYWDQGEQAVVSGPFALMPSRCRDTKRVMKTCKANMILTTDQRQRFEAILFDAVELNPSLKLSSQRPIMSDESVKNVGKVSDRQAHVTLDDSAKDPEDLFNTVKEALDKLPEDEQRRLLGTSPEGQTVSSLKDFKAKMGLPLEEKAQTGAKKHVWDDRYSFKGGHVVTIDSLTVGVGDTQPLWIDSEYEKLLREEGIVDHLPTIDMDYLTQKTPEILTFDWVDKFEQELPPLEGIWDEPPTDAMKTLYPHRTFKASKPPPKKASTPAKDDPNALKVIVARWRGLSGWKKDTVDKIVQELFTLGDGVDRKAIRTLDIVCGVFLLSRFSLVQQTLWESPPNTEDAGPEVDDATSNDVSFDEHDVTREEVLSPLTAFLEETNINVLVGRLQSWFKEDDLFFRVREALDIAPYADRHISDLLYKNLICDVAIKVFGNKAIGDALSMAHVAVEKHVLHKLLLTRLDPKVEAHLGDGALEGRPDDVAQNPLNLESKKPIKRTNYNCDYCHDHEYADIGHECEHCGLNGINPYNYPRRK